MSRPRGGLIVILAALATVVGGASAMGAEVDKGGAAQVTMPDDPGLALEALLAHVPESHRDACRPDLGDQESAIMSVKCELASGITVRYTQLDSPEAMAARYAHRLDIDPVDQDTGDCSQAVPAEESYSIGGEPAGRLHCYEAVGYDSFDWTHDATDIYGEAFQEGDLAGLWDWWSTEAGPIPASDDATPTGLGLALDALLLQVPEAHRSTCLPFDGGGAEDGVVVSVACTVAPDLTVYYSSFDSAEALAARYAGELAYDGVDTDSGDCSQAVPGEQPYTIRGVPAGRLACREFFDEIELTWTHEPSLIEATAYSQRDLADTWAWWLNESGPIG